MSSLTFKNGFKSPLEYISKLVGNSFEKFLTRKLNDVRENLLEIYNLEAEHLEELNHYKGFKIDDLVNFENEIKTYGEISELFQTLTEFIEESKSSVDNEDPLYNEFILLHNEVQKLSETLNKVTDKMNFIHNKILTKSGEAISSEVLKNLWQEEEDLWDNFYLESQSK
jgi:hypothetical protein